MSADERPRKAVPLACWVELLAAVLAIVTVGFLVGAAGITSTSLLIGVMLALLVEGVRR